MTEEDDVFLKIMNQKRDPANRCTEDQFEEVMNFFEETAQTKQPFAAVDNPPVLSFDDMQESMDAAVEESVKRFAKDVYEHWKSRRITTGNRSLMPSLKVNLSSCGELSTMGSKARMSLTGLYSSRRDKTPMIPTHMFASVGARSGRSGRLVAEMLRVPKS